MILVTGGLGFIGTHVVQALLDAGEECLVVQRRHAEVPAGRFTAPVRLAQADVADLDSLRTLGERQRITGIVHLAGSMPWPPSDDPAVEAARHALNGLFNVLQVAADWQVRRLGLASTIGVYAGVTASGGLSEDLPLPMAATPVIPTFKKISELLGAHLATAAGLDIVDYRISGTWGPYGHSDPFFPAPELVHAAAAGRKPDLSGVHGYKRAGDGLDLSYVKDTGRAIALLQTADKLNHRTYNVGSGRATTAGEVAEAIREVVPEAKLELEPGGSASWWLDITRLREDTGFEPEYDTRRAAADYIAWLRAGNER